MKSIIKTITALLVIVITFASADFVNANSFLADTLKSETLVDKEAEFEMIEESLLYGLKSDVNGVLEATFFNAVAYKTLNPDFNSSEVMEGITRIAVNDGNHVVRYKAMLTLSYLKNQESFDVTENILPLIQANDANGTFRVLVDSIQERQVAESSNQ